MRSRKRMLEDLDQDIRDHIERETRDNIERGLSPEEARYAALRRFGNVTRVKEETREVWSFVRLEQLLQDIRFAARMLRRSPSFAAVAVLTLTLGIGANIAVFAVADAVLLRPFPYQQPDRLVVLQHRDQRTGITKQFIAIGDYVDLAQRQSACEALVGYSDAQATIYGQDEPFRALGISAAPGLLDLLGVRPLLGRTLEAEDSRKGAAPVMLLGYDFWRDHFGADSGIVGRGVKIDQVERQVVGIAPQGFHFPPDVRTDVILPMTVPLVAPAQRKSDWTFAVARLKPDTSFARATANFAAISRQLEQEYPSSNQGSEYFPVPLREAVVGNTKPALLLMLAAVGIVLLIACANIANLLLARSLARQREMAVRMALGAGRTRLAVQLLTESLALTFVACSAGILMAHWGVQALLAMIPKSIASPELTNVHLDSRVVAFAIGISAAAAVAFGLTCALTVRIGNLSATLASSARTTASTPARRAASTLVVTEMALAIVLLIGAGLILRTFSRLVSVDPGFRTDRVMTMSISLPADRYRGTDAQRAFYLRAFAALKGLPGVEEAGAAIVVPLTGNNWTVPFDKSERPVPAGERPPEVGWQLASRGYFSALQLPLLAGRLFDEGDGPNAKPVVIISEAIQERYFPNQNALGHQVKVGDQKFEIVGVVGNIRRAGLRDEPRADMYFAFESIPSTLVTLFVRTTSDPLRTLPFLQSTLRSIEPNASLFEMRTMEEIASDSIQVTRLALWLLSVFALTALALAAVGIYGVIAYSVTQRTQEIGVRVALGATKSDIVRLVIWQGMGMATLGTAIGLGAGLIAVRSLRSLLYEVTASDPVTLVLAALVLMATALVASYLPARRALHVDPIVALRYE
jgi:putative ABC transport system permease protein